MRPERGLLAQHREITLLCSLSDLRHELPTANVLGRAHRSPPVLNILVGRVLEQDGVTKFRAPGNRMSVIAAPLPRRRALGRRLRRERVPDGGAIVVGQGGLQKAPRMVTPSSNCASKEAWSSVGWMTTAPPDAHNGTSFTGASDIWTTQTRARGRSPRSTSRNTRA